MKSYFVLFSLFISLVSHAQLPTGNIIQLKGQTFSAILADTLPLAIIEVWSDTTLIAANRTDFDGFFLFNICTSQLVSDTLQFKILAFCQKETSLHILAESNANLQLILKPDPFKKVSLEVLENRAYLLFKECGTDEYNEYVCKNPLFIHCDGRIKSFQEIMNSQGNLLGWNLIE